MADELNDALSARANAFSRVLGEGARAIKTMLIYINLLTVTVLTGLIVWHTRRLVLQRATFETALIEEKKRLAWQASHDSLTGLANRREFERRLRSALDQFKAGDIPHAVILLDLDKDGEQIITRDRLRRGVIGLSKLLNRRIGELCEDLLRRGRRGGGRRRGEHDTLFERLGPNLRSKPAGRFSCRRIS